MFTIFMVVSFGESSSPVGSGCMALVEEGRGRTAYGWDGSTWGDTLLGYFGEFSDVSCTVLDERTILHLSHLIVNT